METPFIVFVMAPVILGGGLLLMLFLLTRIMPGVPQKGAKPEQVEVKGPEYAQWRAKRNKGLRLGVVVLLALALLTIIEFFLASIGSTPLMFIMIILKASLVLYYFMHITSVWRTEEAH